MTGSALPAGPGVSKASIWIALVLGVMAALPFWPHALFATLPLALLIGSVVYVAQRSSQTWRVLHSDNERLAGRVDQLERELAVLKAQVRAGAVGATVAARPSTAAPAATPAGAETPAAPAPQFAPDFIAQEPVAAAIPAAELERQAPWVGPAAAPSGTPAATTTAAPSEPLPAKARRAAAPPRPPAPSIFARGFAAARAWLLGGNTVARVGVLVLFVGVAFLLRYVAERTHVPIEVRLFGVALGAFAFLVLGWRLREKRPGFAITLQGGAVGILYLITFAAMRLYAVLPPLAAFAFMALFALLSGLLAVLQNARALAALGSAGGFLAPILVSTGAGRVALLFSYYLLLNLGVLGIAWFRSWRELNWIGFVFTFAVSGLWAVRRYTPADFVIGQGFLVAFWLLFLVVSLLYALRQPDSKKGLVDTTLVFALPLAAFGIQTRFTEGVELALAAVVAAATYFGVSTWLLRRRDAALRLLTETCFALGVGFLTLAIPLAASAQWTAAAWALEGLALLWVGLRQRRTLPSVAGLLLHLLGAVALLQAIARGDVSIAPQWSGLSINLAVFAVTAFCASRLLASATAWPRSLEPVFAALPWIARAVAWGWVALLIWQPLTLPWYAFGWCGAALGLLALERRGSGGAAISPEWAAGVALVVLAAIATEARFPPDTATALKLVLRLAVAATAVAAALLSLRGPEPARRIAAAGLLTLGVLAWLVALLAEAAARIDAQLALAQLALALIGVTSLALGWLGTQLKWDWPLRLAWSFFAAHLILAAYAVALAVFQATVPSRHYGGLVWPLAWALFYQRLAAQERVAPRLPAVGALHVSGLWLLALMLAAEASLQLDRVAGGDGWFHAAWGATPALTLWLTVQHARRWPMRAAPYEYAQIGAPGLAAFAALWLLWANVRSDGDPAPLPALPLLNPLDLASAWVLAALARWHLADARSVWRRAVRPLLGAATFFAVNIVALRAVHFVAGVGWNAAELARSLIVQSVLSLLWTVTAMALMVVAHRRALRTLWLSGAALLGVVVAKLFFVDLSGQGTIERIVSFVGVGLLLLVIGYLAPVPPATAAAQRTEAA